MYDDRIGFKLKGKKSLKKYRKLHRRMYGRGWRWEISTLFLNFWEYYWPICTSCISCSEMSPSIYHSLFWLQQDFANICIVLTFSAIISYILTYLLFIALIRMYVQSEQGLCVFYLYLLPVPSIGPGTPCPLINIYGRKGQSEGEKRRTGSLGVMEN